MRGIAMKAGLIALSLLFAVGSIAAQQPGPAPPPPQLDVVVLRDCDCYVAGNNGLFVFFGRFTCFV